MSVRLGLVALVALAALAVGCSFLEIKTIGSPWGPSARVGETIVTLMTRLEPYRPTLNRDAGNDRYTIGLLIHSATDSAVRRFLPIATGQRAPNLGLAKLTAVDGDLIRFKAPEWGAYDVKAGTIRDSGLAPPDRPPGQEDLPSGDRDLLSMLVAGGYPSPTRWIGVLSDTEAAKGFQPGATVSDGYPFERSKEPRRFYASEIERVEGKPRIRKLEPIGGDGRLNAAFLRARRRGEILRLAGDGFLLVYETKPYRAGTVMVARVDLEGKVVWTLDTGIGELREVLPDPVAPAFIGDRPRVPDKVSEPILVMVDVSARRLTTHSLWLE